MALIGTAYMMLTWPIQVAHFEPGMMEGAVATAWSCEGAWTNCEVTWWEVGE